MKYRNVVIDVSNYLTDALPRTLSEYGNKGYKLVNTMLVNNKYGIEVMYLFFTKEIGE